MEYWPSEQERTEVGPGRISVLLVTSRQPPAELLECLEDRTSIVRAAGRHEASELLVLGPPVQAVVTDERLADGDWRGVLKDALRVDPAMEVVVYTGPWPEIDLFIEARSLGARSLLVEPYDRYQIQCLIQNARSQVAHKPSAPTNTFFVDPGEVRRG